jgi:hypothetical protein
VGDPLGAAELGEAVRDAVGELLAGGSPDAAHHRLDLEGEASA